MLGAKGFDKRFGKALLVELQPRNGATAPLLSV
jgi:hypothetical protein